MLKLWFKKGTDKIPLADVIYPIGAIYINTTNTNPSVFLGGVWERHAKGKTLVGVDESQTEFATADKMGGHKNLQKHNHGVTIGSGGSHEHSASSGSAGNHSHSASTSIATSGSHRHEGIKWFDSLTSLDTGSQSGYKINFAYNVGNATGLRTNYGGDHAHGASTSIGNGGSHAHSVSVGSGGSHGHSAIISDTGAGDAENLQPYITVYFWRRTA